MSYQLSRHQLLLDLYQAYKDARRHKRNRLYQRRFEKNLEQNLKDLADELWTRTYRPRPSTCFIIEDPKKREVFAAAFRDRIVHHLYYNYVHEMLERTFIHDTYSCIKGRGTHFGIDRLERFIRKESQNYQERCYVLKMDIQGYFMHINRERLLEITLRQLGRMSRHRVGKHSPQTWEQTVDMDFVRWLSGEIILLNPIQDCLYKGSREHWSGLPKSKSLFYSPQGCGLPIGNLTSQLFSNVYLNEFDQYMKRDLGCGSYGRYVDDFYVVSADREWLCSLQKPVAAFLSERLGLEVNKGKTVIHDVRNGVEFIGAFLKPYRRYVSSNTLRRIRRKLPLLEDALCTPEHLCNSLNSFLGILSHYRTYLLRRKMFLSLRRCHLYGTFTNDIRKYTLYNNMVTMKYFHLKHRVQEVALMAALPLGSTPMVAQSGIDSLGNGGSLGGDTGMVGTGMEQVVTAPSAKSPATGSTPAYYTLGGQPVHAPRRGEVYIIRWRELGKWRTKKVLSATDADALADHW